MSVSNSNPEKSSTFAGRPSGRRSQQQRVLDKLLQGFCERREIPLPELMNLRIAQLNTRICELREMGWQIVNRQDAFEGQRRSFYSLKSAIQSIPCSTEKATEPAKTQRPGWKSEGFSFGNRKDPQPAKPAEQEPLFKNHLGAVGL